MTASLGPITQVRMVHKKPACWELTVQRGSTFDKPREFFSLAHVIEYLRNVNVTSR